MIGGVILCVGDSLTHGARDPHGLTYPALLARKISEKYGQAWVGVEKGINGEKSADVLRRYYDVCRSYKEASEICLWVGTNDAKRPGVDPEVFRKNLLDMVRITKFLRKPLFIGTLPGQKGFGAPDYVDNGLIEAYNDIIFEEVERLGDAGQHVWYVDLRELPAEYFCDGIHLTHEGNEWVAGKFAEVIELERSGRPVWKARPEKHEKSQEAPPTTPKHKAAKDTVSPAPRA